MPGLAEKWEISPDGTVYTFNLRKGVKWHNTATSSRPAISTPTTCIFTIERQWKEDHPYFKVTSPNHSYFTDMGMPKLLKSVEKVDDYTVKITLNTPEAPFLVRPRDGISPASSRRNMPTPCSRPARRRRSTRSRSAPARSIWCSTRRTPSSATRRSREYWGGKAKIDDLVFAITPDASVRWAKLQKGECHVMPYPNPADLDAIRKDAERHRCWSSRA